MATGDKAIAAGYGKVPESGSDAARVRWGAEEINKTRDDMADLKAAIPTTKPAFRIAAGITAGTADPTGGSEGDIYFKIIL